MLPNLHRAVQHWNSKLAVKRDGSAAQLHTQGIFVYRFDESWTEVLVNIDRSANDLACEPLIFQTHLLPSFLVSWIP
jgi:hypothetical protein